MRHTEPHHLLSAACIAAGLGFAGPAAADTGPGPTSVVGGHPVPVGRWPDAAAVTNGRSAFCTGTLIGPEVVLTAGHCVARNQLVSVKLGATDADGPGEVIRIARAAVFPDWQTTYDLGLLLLEHPSTIAPRAVATQCAVAGALVDGAPVTVVGFGATTRQGDDVNTRLREGEARVLDAKCSGGNGCTEAVSPGGEFVAGGDGVDSCFGDSGGPVYLATPEGTVLAGVASRGLEDSPTPCGGGGIYIRPDPVLDWIDDSAGQPVLRASCAHHRTEDPDPGSDRGASVGGSRDPGAGGDGSRGGCSSARDARGRRTTGSWPALALFLIASLLLRRRPTGTRRATRAGAGGAPSGGETRPRRAGAG